MATAQESIEKSYNFVKGSMVECPKNKGKFITSNMLAYGDYDNSGSIQRSNVQYIIDRYASNRYIIITGGYDYTQVYLKNTKVNAELICNLAEYPAIDDEYLSNWEYDRAKEQFLDTDLNEIPFLYDVLTKHYKDTDVDVSEIDNSEYFWDLYNTISEQYGQQAYYFENDNVVFCLSDSYYKDEIQLLIKAKLLTDNSFKPLLRQALLDNLKWIINGIESIAKTQNVIGCLCLNSYSEICWYDGTSDYMTSHQYPFQEIEFDKHSDKQTIVDILVETYERICDDNYEQLDMIPC